MDYSDCWNTVGAAKGRAKKIGLSEHGPKYVRAHVSLYNEDRSPRTEFNDDLMGTGVPGAKRLRVAKRAGKRIIACTEPRDAVSDTGGILPVSQFGRRSPYFLETPIVTVGRSVVRADVLGADIIQAGNEVFAWEAKPDPQDYFDYVADLIDHGSRPVIADYHPDMPRSIAQELFGIEINPALSVAVVTQMASAGEPAKLEHIFPKPTDSNAQVAASIHRGADQVRAIGGTPLCLEAILGRGISLWTKQGEERFAVMDEAFRESGCTIAPVWWGGFENLQPKGGWTAPGWPQYPGLFLFGPDGKPSGTAKRFFPKGGGTVEPPTEPPPVDPPDEEPEIDELVASVESMSNVLVLASERLEQIIQGEPPAEPPTEPPTEPPPPVEVDRLQAWMEKWREKLKDNVGLGITEAGLWRVDTLRHGHFGPDEQGKVMLEAERAWRS